MSQKTGTISILDFCFTENEGITASHDFVILVIRSSRIFMNVRHSQTLKGDIPCRRMFLFLSFPFVLQTSEATSAIISHLFTGQTNMTMTMTFLLLSALLLHTNYMQSTSKRVMALKSFVSFQYFQHRMESLLPVT